jgi:ubiquinone/menaquinone biosynthesis C-methylase UbiE
MEEKEQAYAKASFSDVAHKYDEIPFFKISAGYVADIVQSRMQSQVLSILDVACGTGNVVLECAKQLPHVNFHAMDISQGMLDKATANAENLGLQNIDFCLQDITKLEDDRKYDVITCSYALFFLPEAHKVLQKLVSLLHEEGMVIFTSFLSHAFSPSTEILMPLLEKYGSESAKAYDMNKWENLKHVADIERLCQMAEVNAPTIESKKIRYGMSVDEWWELLNNTGYKGMLMELSEEDYEKLRYAYYQAMFEHADMDGEVELNADSYYVVVTK